MFNFKLLVCLSVAAVTLAVTTPQPAFTGTAVEVAAAVNSSDPVPGAQDAEEIYLCANRYFMPPCVTVPYLKNTCTNVPFGFNDNVSSVKPAQGAVCTLYADISCRGQNIVTVYPGYSDLLQQGFNDRLSSWECS
ncbi:hypothetical protein MSAN_01591000 [Mycena sanguinolenta]|uniref:Uncharacterized protein n=1 Tax=Mycena sanguinolenta TaxID=230812 RepID=A0A8H6Y066_9AGAR|nr:hypothetical protein MSAN_01591000 [Mycena sanguinolenta]